MGSHGGRGSPWTGPVSGTVVPRAALVTRTSSHQRGFPASPSGRTKGKVRGTGSCLWSGAQWALLPHRSDWGTGGPAAQGSPESGLSPLRRPARSPRSLQRVSRLVTARGSHLCVCAHVTESPCGASCAVHFSLPEDRVVPLHNGETEAHSVPPHEVRGAGAERHPDQGSLSPSCPLLWQRGAPGLAGTGPLASGQAPLSRLGQCGGSNWGGSWKSAGLGVRTWAPGGHSSAGAVEPIRLRGWWPTRPG